MRVVDDKREYELTGRVAKMVRWIVRRAKRVTRPQNIQVVFDCAASTVNVTIKEREPAEAAFLR